jgi:hypothetical protein
VGFKAAAPVIVALERFREERGQYPGRLDELVPTYVSDASAFYVRGKVRPVHSPRAAASAPSQERSALGYRQDGDTYKLGFSYEGPGMNECWYDLKTKMWECHGYY